MRGLSSPLSVRVDSTRSVASSQALFRGVPLEDICVAAERSSLHTFIRFYNLDLETASVRVPIFYLLEPAMYTVWFLIGPDRPAFLAWRVWYIVPKAS